MRRVGRVHPSAAAQAEQVSFAQQPQHTFMVDPVPAPPHTHIVITFQQGGDLRFVDPRTFGEMFVSPVDDLGKVKELAHIAVNDGVAAADEAMARVQAPIWASEDLKTGLASFRKNGPGLAKFAGR